MKKWLSLLLLIVLLSHVLPLNALATIGKVLTHEELAAAYALTGYGTDDGASANAVYHRGMQPNATWNAQQMSDWLDDVLKTDLFNVEDILSRAAVALEKLKKKNPEAYDRLSGGDSQYVETFEDLRQMYREAEALREEMRYAKDYLEERANLIAEMGRQLEEESGSMFSSERVRLSAMIETAAAELDSMRKETAAKADGWTAMIDDWSIMLLVMTAGAGEMRPTWFEELYSYDDAPVENTARVVAVSAANTRMGKLSSGESVLAANDSESKVFVLSENQIAIEMFTGKDDKMYPVPGIEVTVLDTRNPNATPVKDTTDENGRIIFLSNMFTADDDKMIHLKVDVEAEAQGFRSYGASEIDVKMGQAYKGVLKPLDDKPYIYSASFHGYDIWTQKFTMLYSDLINVDFDIEVVTRNPGNEGLTPTLRFAYFKKDDGWGTITQKYRKHLVDADSRDGNTFVFRGPWKKNITPWLDEDLYPYFTFDGADKDDKLRYNSRLITKKSAVDQPLEKGTLAFVNVMGKGFSFKINIPGSPFPSSIKFDLGIEQYAPQISVDIAGYVSICIGSSQFKEAIKGSKLNWMNKEMKEYTAEKNALEKKGFLADKLANLGLAYKYYTKNKVNFMVQSKIDVGAFMLFSGRWSLDNSIEDVKTRLIAFRAGSGILVKYSFSWTVQGVIVVIPAYFSWTISISAGFQIGWEVSFAWVNGEFHNWAIKPIKDITITISPSITVQAGVGIKGFVEIWGRYVIGLSFRLHLVIFGQERSMFTGDLFMNVNVGVTLLFVTYSMELWAFNKHLFDVPLANAAPPLQKYAYANEGPEVVNASTQEPVSYPGLVPTARQLELFGSNPRSQFRVAVIDGQTYMFYLASVTGGDGKAHMRVNWVNVNDYGTWGTMQTAIDAWETNLNRYNDYAFDVYVADGFVYLLATSAAEFDKEGLPRPNVDLKVGDACNQVFYVTMLQPNGEGNLTTTLKKGYYRTGYEYGTGGMEQSHKNELVDHVLVMGQPVGYIEGHESGMEKRLYYYDSIDNPEITWARALSQEGIAECTGVEIFGTFGRVTYSPDETPYGVTSFELLPSQGTGSALIKGQPAAKCFTDQYVQSGMGKDYVRTEVRGAMRCSNTEPKVHDRTVDQHYSPGFLALSQPKDGGEGDRAIEMFDFEMNGVVEDRTSIVLEKGDIEHFEMAQTAVDGDGTNYRRMVFYTARETGEDGDVRNRLHGLYLEPLVREGRNLTFDVTKYTYDLTVPTGGMFNLVYIGDVPYLYWITSIPNENEDDQPGYRIMTSAYDISTNTMTDPAVYAEFKLPQYDYTRYVRTPGKSGWQKYSLQLDMLPQALILTGTGTAYLTAVADTSAVRNYIDSGMAPETYMIRTQPVIAYSFPVQMKPMMELKDLIFEDTTVCTGEFEDVTVGVMNTGNMGIAKFDLELYTLEDGKANVAETIHADCLHPENSTLTMMGSTESEKLPDNAPVIYRNSDFDYTARQRDWVLEDEKKRYRVIIARSIPLDSVETVDSDAQFVKTDMLMPGALGSFAGTVKIPGNWSGETTLYMRVKSISTYSNWVRAMANAAGAKNNGLMPNAAVPEELTWVLDEASGKMVLQTGQIDPNGLAANAVRSGVIANAVDASGDIAISVGDQDIEVSHRIYGDSEDNDMLDIVISNYTDTDDSFKLTCAVYLDQEDEPYYINLPYYSGGLANRHTHTITMPVRALVPDMEDHYQARVVISAVGREESAYLNNEFVVDLGSSGLHIIEQPQDQTVQEGEDVSFSVTVGGGVKPYSYQWQVWDEKHQKWVNLPGFTEPTLSRKDIEKKWDGCRFRCVITDSRGTQVITDEVTLTVRDRVDTGDHSNLPLYLAIALAALLLLWLVRRRMKQVG